MHPAKYNSLFIAIQLFRCVKPQQEEFSLFMNDGSCSINNIIPIFGQISIQNVHIMVIISFFCQMSPLKCPEPVGCASLFYVNYFTVLLAISFTIPIHRRQIVGDGKTQRRIQEEHRGSLHIKQQNTVVQNSKTLRTINTTAKNMNSKQI